MPIIPITTSTDPFYSQKTLLDGRDFILSFQYNQRENRIYLSIADDEADPIISGIKVMANWPLLFRHNRYNTALPPGEMIAFDTSGDGSPPGLGELGIGKRVQLVYFDAAWIAANRASQPITSVPIYIAVRVTPLGGYPGDAAYTVALASACGGLSVPGTRISTDGVLAAAATIASATVTGLVIGGSPPSPGPVSIIPASLSVGANERPIFSASWINVVSA